MIPPQEAFLNSAAEVSAVRPMAQWCEVVIWADISALALAGIAAIPGFFGLLRAPSGIMLIAGVLLWALPERRICQGILGPESRQGVYHNRPMS